MTPYPSLLAIDVGNSRIKYGWFTADTSAGDDQLPACRHFAADSLMQPAPWDRIRTWTDPLTCDVVIAGSNPAVVEQVATHWQATTGRTPWVLRDRHALPIRIDVESPDRVGLDRLLNAVAANALRTAENAAIIVDSGTATTVDAVSPDGKFLGGAILPGFALSSRALHLYTALLPELGLGELGPEQPPALGRSTRAALRSGIYWAQVGAVHQLIAQLCSELRWKPPETVTRQPAAVVPAAASCRLFLTGGGAHWLEAQFPGAPVLPSLAMHGLVLAAWHQGVGTTLSDIQRPSRQAAP